MSNATQDAVLAILKLMEDTDQKDRQKVHSILTTLRAYRKECVSQTTRSEIYALANNALQGNKTNQKMIAALQQIREKTKPL